ncbi:MAG: YncE family protein [Jatrophihabitans sp.]|uniref:YncE family protein n=1 Tax=Jatrophihabitans sp. TaxID=1932789 RepID=UPI003F7EE480
MLGNPRRLASLSAAGLALGVGLVAPPARADVTATVALPAAGCCVTQTVAVGQWVVALADPPQAPDGEQATLVRIDPATGAVTGSLTLPNGMPTGNSFDVQTLTVAGGALWVPAFFEDQVLRVDPATMTVTARVATGRSPGSLVSDGRSVWGALQNEQAVVRIDPARNAVVQTVRVGSKDVTDRPYQVAWDGSQVLVSMPTSGRVARIDPATARVRYDAVGTAAAACARILPAAGGYWLDDTECGIDYYRWDAHRQRITVTLDPTPHFDWGAAVVGGRLYTGEFHCDDGGCEQGWLVERDGVTGAVIASQDIGAEDYLPSFAAGGFWVADWDAGLLRRVAAF